MRIFVTVPAVASSAAMPNGGPSTCCAETGPQVRVTADALSHRVVRYKRTTGALVAALLAAHRRILCTKEWHEGSLDGDDGDASWLSSQRSTRYRDSRPPTSMGNPDPWNGKSSKACLTAPRGCRGNYWC